VKPKPIYWQYCPKCGQLIGLYEYPVNRSPDYGDDIRRELDILQKEHQCLRDESKSSAGDEKEVGDAI